MKRTKVFAGLVCALLAAVQLGCGAFQGNTNNLQSITLNVALINGVAPTTGQGGEITLQGNGGTIQLKPMGNYTNGKSVDLTNKVDYKVMVDPAAPYYECTPTSVCPLIPPCQPGDCPIGSPGAYTSGTVEYSSTGLLTAVEPAACTFAPGSTSYVGDYQVTVTYQGITSQPVYVPVASSSEPDGSDCGEIGTFSLSASPSSLSASPGSDGQTSISIIPSNGFNGYVTLSASSLPSGVSASFSQNPAQSSSLMTLTVGSSTAAGTYSITVIGTANNLNETTTVTLTVP